MSTEIEHRAFILREIRAAGDGKTPKIEGYAAVFNSLSEDLGGWFERIQDGAFTKTLEEMDVRALFNHDPNYVLGRTKNQKLTLREDNLGLAFENEPPDTQWARDLLTSIERGDIDQMSFGFRTIRDRWEQVGDQIIRTLVEVKLYDVSLVAFPAYPQTAASVRSAFEAFRADPTAAPGQEPHPAAPLAEAEAQARLAILRRRLDLAERSS
jgi:HK97 family phage prohead protease